MEIEVRGRHMRLTEALRQYVEKRLRFALGRFDNGVRRALVRLEDTNGPKGGVDKRCSLELYVDGQKPSVAQAVDVDMYAAIDRASGVAGRMLSTARAKRREFRGMPHALVAG